jgi:O-antigen/teichoic acid export membrane protein
VLTLSKAFALGRRSADSSISIGTAFVLQGALIVSGVIAARLLGAENRGFLALLVLYPAVLGVMGTLGIPASVTYHIAKSPEASRSVIRKLGAPLGLVTAGLVLIHMTIVLVLRNHDAGEIRMAALITLVATPAVVLQSFGMAIIQGLQKFLLYNVLRALQLVAYSAALVGLAVLQESNLALVAGSWTFSMVLGAAVVLFLAQRVVPPTLDVAPVHRREMLRFGLRGMFGSANLVEIVRLDQLAVSLVASPTVLGLYVVGASFSNLPRFVATSVGMMAFPRVASSGDRGTATAVRYTILAAIVCGIIVLGIEAILGPVLPLFFGKGFEDSVGVGRVLLISAYLYSLRRVAGDCARGLDLPELTSITELVSLLVLVPAILVLSTKSELLGVAWALTVSSAVSLLLLLVLISRSLAARKSADVLQPRELLSQAIEVK